MLAQSWSALLGLSLAIAGAVEPPKMQRSDAPVSMKVSSGAKAIPATPGAAKLAPKPPPLPAQIQTQTQTQIASAIQRHEDQGASTDSSTSLLRREVTTKSSSVGAATAAAAAANAGASAASFPFPIPVGNKVGGFDSYDTNRNGKLEETEAAKLMKDMRLPTAAWRYLDSDHNGAISRDGFGRLQQDATVFRAADKDGSAFLEAREVEAVMARAGITAQEFNWHSFDHDGDGRLSEPEFLAAGPAAAHAASMAAESLLEEAAEGSHEAEEEDEGQVSDEQVWAHSDQDASGFLEAREMNFLLHKAGIEGFDWQSYDHDKDGKMSKAEFMDMAPEARELSAEVSHKQSA